MKVLTGLERLAQGAGQGHLQGRLGLLCNQASVTSSFEHAKGLFSSLFPGRLTALFSPQHGLYAEKQDNMVESDDGFDPGTGVPVFSLYGRFRKPQPHHLNIIDTLVVDLQDVGCRVYTFIWTILLAMEACAEMGKKMVVLDRPNPLGGRAEGNLLDPGLSSFVGMHPIPMRHGMTVGELAMMFRDERGLDLDLHVVEMEGWSRDIMFPDTGIPWIWPSPNMPAFETALVYPGQVLLEGTNLSEGRGTTRPFEVFGAPWMDVEGVVSLVSQAGLEGFVLREQWFEPTFHKWAGKSCKGLQIHVTSRERFRPYETSLAILAAVAKTSPTEFAWRPPPYEYEYERLPIDLLVGNREVRKGIEDGCGPGELEPLWREELAAFIERRRRWLLY